MILEVTTDGKVFLDGREKKQFNHSRGYKLVHLRGNSKYVHRLVGEYHIPNPNNLPEINHKNGIKSDNRVENLEWVTRQQNMNHAFELGLHPTGRKISFQQAEELRSLYSSGQGNYASLGRKYKIDPKTAWEIINNKTYQRGI